MGNSEAGPSELFQIGVRNGPFYSFINQSLDAGCPPARKGHDQGLDVCLQLRAIPSKGYPLSTVLAAGIKDFSLKWDAGRCRAMPTTVVYVPDALFLSDLPFKAHGFHVHGCFMISRRLCHHSLISALWAETRMKR